jgi:hypothetical protein
MTVSIDKISKNSIVVYRERPVTKAERRKDPDAKIMAEWVTIAFSDATPVMTFNRDLCE